MLPMAQKPLRIGITAGMARGKTLQIFGNLREVHTSLGYALHTVKPLDP